MGISVGLRAWLGAAVAASVVLLSGAGALAADPLEQGDIVVSHTPQLIGSPTTLYRIDAASGTPEAIVQDVGWVFAVADSTTIYSVQNVSIPATSWKVWKTNVVSGVPTLFVEIPATDYAFAVALEPGGTLLVRGSNDVAQSAWGSLVRIDLTSGAHETLASGVEFGSTNGFFEGISLVVD